MESTTKPALKESEKRFLPWNLIRYWKTVPFKKQEGKFLRLNEGYNTKKEASQTKDLQLHLTDSYNTIPTYEQLYKKSIIQK